MAKRKRTKSVGRTAKRAAAGKKLGKVKPVINVFEFNSPSDSSDLGQAFNASGICSELAADPPPSVTVTLTLNTTDFGWRSYSGEVITYPLDPHFDAYFEGVDPGADGILTAACTNPILSPVPITDLRVQGVSNTQAVLTEPTHDDSYESVDDDTSPPPGPSAVLATAPDIRGRRSNNRKIYAFVTKKGTQVLPAVEVPKTGNNGTTLPNTVSLGLRSLFPPGTVKAGKYGIVFQSRKTSSNGKHILSRGFFRLRNDA